MMSTDVYLKKWYGFETLPHPHFFWYSNNCVKGIFTLARRSLYFIFSSTESFQVASVHCPHSNTTTMWGQDDANPNRETRKIVAGKKDIMIDSA